MEIMYANNSLYKFEKKFGDYSVYTAVDINDGIHVFRYIQASAQERYNAAGITADSLAIAMDEIIKRANDKNWETARTDIGVIANSLKYRLANPVDEHCALRMGHVLTFMECDKVEGLSNVENAVRSLVSEDPKSTNKWWMDKKMELSMSDPDAYAFFLDLGLASSQKYRETSDISIDMNYFLKRQEMLASFKPLANK